MFMQNLGGQTKSIMVFSEMAYWATACRRAPLAQPINPLVGG